MDIKPKRRARFQFSLRLLLVAVLVLCLGLGLVGNIRHKVAVRKTKLDRLGAQFTVTEPQPDWDRWLWGDNPVSFASGIAIHSDIRLNDLDALNGLPNISMIGIQGGIEPGALLPLTKMRSLQTISIVSKTLNDEALKDLGACTQLRHLHIGFCPQITDAGISSLEHLVALEELYLREVAISDASMPYIAKCQQLKRLELIGVPLSDKGFAHLEHLTGLQSLNICNSRITDDGLSAIQHLTRLETLLLPETGINGRGLEHIAKIKNLKSLDLAKTNISDADLERLGQLPQLLDLDIQETKVSSEGLRHLVSLKSLRSLTLSRNLVPEAKAQFPDISIYPLILSKMRKPSSDP